MTVLVLGALHHFARPFSLAYIELAASLSFIAGAALLVAGIQVCDGFGSVGNFKALERPLPPHSPTACAALLPSTPTSARWDPRWSRRHSVQAIGMAVEHQPPEHRGVARHVPELSARKLARYGAGDGRGAHRQESPRALLRDRPMAGPAFLVRGSSRRITTMTASSVLDPRMSE